ncbi:MAG: phage related protein Gp53, partial [Elusimicrobia bacterium]
MSAVLHHRWTNADGKVLVLKCIEANGTSHDGAFRWPESGPVECPDWDSAPRCPDDNGKGGGLFGWAWGIGVGDGKDPSYLPTARWLVVACDPADVVLVKDASKVKFRRGEVVYCGNWTGAYGRVIDGQIAWITATSSGNTAASGWRGNAAASGWSGNAAASGWRGNAAASGWSGNAAASGERGNAAAS